MVEAVALGMIIETKISELENLISPEKAQHIAENIQKYYPYISISAFSNEEIISLMLNDKKNDHGKINFSILEGLGKCNYDYKVSQEHIEQTLELLQKHQCINITKPIKPKVFWSIYLKRFGFGQTFFMEFCKKQ